MKALDRPRRPWWRRILGYFVLFVMAWIAVVGWAYWYGGKELREAIAATTALDPHWRIEEMEAERAPVSDAENGALIILAAKTLIGNATNDDNDATSKVSDYLEQPNRRLNDEARTALGKFLDKHRPALAELHKLKDVSRGRFPLTYRSSEPIPSTESTNCRWTVQALQWEMHELIDKGDIDGALENVLCLCHAVSCLGDEPFLMSMLSRVSWSGMATTATRQLLAKCQLNEQQLSRLQAAFAIEMCEPILRRGLRGSRFEMFMAMEQAKTNQMLARLMFGSPDDFWEEQILYRFPGYIGVPQAALLLHMNKSVALASRPYEELFQRFAELDEEAKQLPERAQKVYKTFGLVANCVLRHQAALRCVQVALAAERFRLAQGRWPERLDDLVAAKLMNAVPLDPFDGQPLRWKMTPGGRIVYSVHHDLIDDNGAIDYDENGPARDWGIRLFNPDQRNLPALPPKPKEEPPSEMP